MVVGAHRPDEAPDILARFGEQVLRRPDALALDGGPVRLTYGGLDRVTRELADRFAAAGVRPGHRVGFLFGSGLTLAAAAVAALRARAAFLPLDRRQPPGQLAEVIERAEAQLVVCDHSTEALVPAGCHKLVLSLPGERPQAPAAPDPSAMPAPEPEDLAYVFHTSGSTGRPKGVAVGYRELSSFSTAFADKVGLRCDDVVLQAAALGFDVVIEEIFPALATGATVAFAPTDDPLAPEELSELMERRGVTSVELATAYWHEWVRHLVAQGRRPPRALRRVLVGSDRLDRELVGQWLSWGVPLLHVYGTTESVVTNTVHTVDEEAVTAPDRPVPVGTALAHCAVHILDEEQRPVAAGDTGEIAISGSLARGYLGAPELTRDRFVEISPGDGAGPLRVYLTGDRGRLRPDGALEFLGREDAQIKIHGYRLELGHVEVVLERVGWVERAVVVKTTRGETAQLVGFVKTTGTPPAAPPDGELTPEQTAELRAHCRNELPAHAVPARFLRVGTFPLTVNGKVDRVGLATTAETAGPRTPPAAAVAQDPVCAAVLHTWQEVLGTTDLDAGRGFIAQGGSSLAAMRVITRLRTRFGVPVPLSVFLRSGSAHEVARYIGDRLPSPSPSGARS
ncbi:amino acid adenylation domain-containing protein [Streptomyces sp. NPDC049099]|uniref:amino acid adenylation domain-containing protein n=1 Tax=Streptomyces sp. NPDC049099 TaxID=3155768 RepID=UPI0034452484